MRSCLTHLFRRVVQGGVRGALIQWFTHFISNLYKGSKCWLNTFAILYKSVLLVLGSYTVFD